MCFLDQFTITCARWSPNGSFVAVSGFMNDVSQQERCCVHIVSAYGSVSPLNSQKSEVYSETGTATGPGKKSNRRCLGSDRVASRPDR